MKRAQQRAASHSRAQCSLELAGGSKIRASLKSVLTCLKMADLRVVVICARELERNTSRHVRTIVMHLKVLPFMLNIFMVT